MVRNTNKSGYCIHHQQDQFIVLFVICLLLKISRIRVIGADLNAHVGEGNTNDEEAMGKHGFGRRNLEGQTVVDFTKR